MKKLLALILTVFVSLTFISCDNTEAPKNSSNKNNSVEETEPKEKLPVSVSIGSLKGPTSIGMIKLIDDNSLLDYENYTASTKIYPSPDLLIPKLLKGEIDMATVPVNVASKIYNVTKGEYKLAAINTLGVLYMLSSDSSVTDLSSLKGKTIYCGASLATPDFVLKYLLEQSGLSQEDVTINYTLGFSEVAKGLIGGTIENAILPEPLATLVTLKNKSINRFLDVQEAWRNENDNSNLLMGALVVKSDFYENNKEFVSDFLKKYSDSISWVNTDLENSSKLLVKYELLPSENIAKLSIPKCNIVYYTAQDKKDEIDSFLKIIYNFDKGFVGGKIPDDEFYIKSEK